MRVESMRLPGWGAVASTQLFSCCLFVERRRKGRIVWSRLTFNNQIKQTQKVLQNRRAQPAKSKCCVFDNGARGAFSLADAAEKREFTG